VVVTTIARVPAELSRSQRSRVRLPVSSGDALPRKRVL
jgi:hypothetical protein